LDVVKQDPFGAVSLDTDLPGVMSAGTFSLNSVGGGTGSLTTGNTDAFSVAKTGELTVEFWFNPDATGLKYIAEFGDEGVNSWDIYQFDTGGNISIHTGFRDKNGTYAEMNTGALFTTGGGWSHVAVTMSADGTARLYVDGSQVATQSYTPANFEVSSSFFRLGAGKNAVFSNNFLMDELRISDVALLAGTGTGVGELAWNTSLVPEPASLMLLGLGVLALVSSRR